MASKAILERIFDLHINFFMNTQNGLLRAAAMRGSRPGNRETAQELIQYHERIESACRQGGPISVTRIRNHQYPPSCASLQDLCLILLINLELDTANRGYYVKLRTVSTTFLHYSITCVVEDEEQNFTTLYLDHYYDTEDANGILPKESVILIKEPFYTCTYEGRSCIRVDHPSDLVVLLEGDQRIPRKWRQHVKPVSGYNSIGFQAWRNWEYTKSLRMSVYRHITVTCQKLILNADRYNTALSLKPTTHQTRIIRHNRTAVLLKLQCYDAVLEDTQHLLKHGPIKESALIRAVEAAYGLQQYDVCQSYLAVLKGQFPACAEHGLWTCKVGDRLEEKMHGTYDFTYLWKHPPTSEEPCVDFATYIGPMEARETESRGRGLFTTKPVKAGELLLCEKAFSAKMPESPQSRKRGCFVISSRETVLTMNYAAFAVRTDIVQKLERNPSLRASFEHLYDGGYRANAYNHRDDESKQCVDA